MTSMDRPQREPRAKRFSKGRNHATTPDCAASFVARKRNWISHTRHTVYSNPRRGSAKSLAAWPVYTRTRWRADRIIHRVVICVGVFKRRKQLRFAR